MLVPGLSYAFETFIECLSDKGIADLIKASAAMKQCVLWTSACVQ